MGPARCTAAGGAHVGAAYVAHMLRLISLQARACEGMPHCTDRHPLS